MRAVAALLLCLAALCCATTQRPPSLDEAGRLSAERRWTEAAAVLEELVELDPDNAQAWFSLGVARHRLGLYDSAIEASGRAAADPALRATAEFNTACSLARQGRIAAGLEALDRALEAGFFDAQALARDPDLDSLRSQLGYPTIAAVERHTLDLGATSVPYTVLAPTGNPAEPLLITPRLDPGELEHALVHRGWSVLGIGSPAGPSLRADEASHVLQLLDVLGVRHPAHMLGRGRGGITAFHVVLEGPERFASLTVAPGYPGHAQDSNRLHRLVGVRVRLFVGGRDTFWLEQSRWTWGLLQGHGVDALLQVLAEDGHGLESLGGGVLADIIDGLRDPTG
jgi:hypothetical protein